MMKPLIDFELIRPAHAANKPRKATPPMVVAAATTYQERYRAFFQKRVLCLEARVLSLQHKALEPKA